MTTIRGAFCLGARTFTTPMVDQEPNNGRTTVWVTCGIPGVGKTTISEAIRSAYPPFHCAVVSRDEIRTDILMLDEENQKHWSAIVIDGCHTDYKTLEGLLIFLGQFGSRVLIHLMLIGDADSVCYHSINDRKEGDYSDYGPHGHHQALPDCVVKRKRAEMKDLLDNHFKCLLDRVDDLYWLRECAGRPPFSQYYRENQSK